jgi:uncharacterized protein (TIGR02186 family)
MRALLSVLALLFAIAVSGGAAKAGLVTDLSQHQVSIRSNFTGTEILIFGAIEADSAAKPGQSTDVAIVVSGPRRDETVRKKERVAGVWINYNSVTFASVPGFYAVASTRPFETIASERVRAIEQIGAHHLTFGKLVATSIEGTRIPLDVEEAREFTDALIRRKREQGLFHEAPEGVAFLSNTLFRTSIEIPANVPVGLYTAKVYLIRDGNVIDAISTPLFIDKSGMERIIFRLAHREPLLYGIFAVMLATFAGWTAALIYRE